MRALNAAYRKKKGESFDKSASVLFIIPESVSGSDEDRRGFMPRRSQFGYLMDGELSPAQAPIRAAHELGHGRFTLYPSTSLRASPSTSLRASPSTTPMA